MTIVIFLDNAFYVRRKLTSGEQETKQHNNNKVIEFSISQIKKWIGLSIDNERSILEYLKFKNIKITGIN